MRAMILSFAASALLLQACGTTTLFTTPVPTPAVDQCGAAALQVLVGQPVRVLPDSGPWATKRIIRPGQLVTQEFSATRLNVQVDGAGRILALTCG